MTFKYSMFVGSGFVGHAGAQWIFHHAMSFLTYLIPDRFNLKDSMSFGQRSSLGPMTERTKLSVGTGWSSSGEGTEPN